MAEQVNRRIEDMINELEQMQRIDLYSNEEIRLVCIRILVYNVNQINNSHE